jgi:hypothetical protein
VAVCDVRIVKLTGRGPVQWVGIVMVIDSARCGAACAVCVVCAVCAVCVVAVALVVGYRFVITTC